MSIDINLLHKFVCAAGYKPVVTDDSASVVYMYGQLDNTLEEAAEGAMAIAIEGLKALDGTGKMYKGDIYTAIDKLNLAMATFGYRQDSKTESQPEKPVDTTVDSVNDVQSQGGPKYPWLQ